jgi:hypothetical protein
VSVKRQVVAAVVPSACWIFWGRPPVGN